MKTMIFGLLIAMGLMGQTLPQHVIMAGINYNPDASPNVMGEVAYGSQITAGTYSYTSVDIMKITVKPVGVVTQTETGIAQYMRGITIGKKVIDLFTTAQVGTAVTGTGGVGASFSGGYLAATKLKGNWYVAIFGKVLKSTVSGAPTTAMVGLDLAWGK